MFEYAQENYKLAKKYQNPDDNAYIKVKEILGI